MTHAPGADDERVRRAEAIAEQAALLDRRREAETREARRLIADFVTRATEDGPPPVALQATSHDRRATYRTALRGWYLRADRSVAVSTDGEFYVLSVPRSFGARLRGAEPVPAQPPLVLGRGGRDGESVDLAVALRTALGRDR